MHLRRGAGFSADLRPGSRGTAQIEHHTRLGQQIILFVELNQLEGGTRAVSLLLGQVIELVCERHMRQRCVGPQKLSASHLFFLSSLSLPASCLHKPTAQRHGAKRG